MESRVCELCGGGASLYCASDSAFLCLRCDADVHGANFLVARHVRTSVCSSCRSLSDDRFSGAGLRPLPAFCRSCSGERTGPPGAGGSESLSSGSESESDCVSCTGSAAVAAPAKIRTGRKGKLVEILSSSSSLTEISGKDSARLPSGEVSSSGASRMVEGGRNRSVPAVKRIDARAEGILGIWRQRMGLSESLVVDWAARALGSCGGEMTALPLRVLLAASFWLGLRMCSGCKRDDASWQVQIRRLEEVSGVPTRLIVAAAARLARASGVRRLRRGLEEGCGEC